MSDAKVYLYPDGEWTFQPLEYKSDDYIIVTEATTLSELFNQIGAKESIAFLEEYYCE